MKGAKLIFSLALIGLIFSTGAFPAFGFFKGENWENFWEKTRQLPKKGAITWAICNLRERVKILEEKVAQMEEEIEEALARIENLEGGFEDLDAKVEELEGEVEDLNSRVESLEGWKETMEEWKGETEDWKIDVEGRLDDLQRQIMYVKDQIFDILVALTPERLLERIKMVDGEGSGLDADMVDGKHADEISLWGEGEGYIYPKNASSSIEITDEGNFYVLGNVGIGTKNPTEKLSVNGIIESTSGGFKFPDGTIQTTAASCQIKVVTGVAAHNDLISPPEGYTVNDCHIIASPRDFGPEGDTLEGWRHWCYVTLEENGWRVYARSQNQHYGDSWSNDTVNYLMICQK